MYLTQKQTTNMFHFIKVANQQFMIIIHHCVVKIIGCEISHVKSYEKKNIFTLNENE